MKKFILSFFLITLSYLPKAQKKIDDSTAVSILIERSQSGALPLKFSVNNNYLLKSVDTFSSDKEFLVRSGLPNFFKKLKQKRTKLRVAFLGGSITKAEEQYRNQTLAYLQTLHPKAIIEGINAGVSGTGTELGACRLKEQVLQYQPDLVFIEFAVNGGSNQALEGIVRQVIRNSPFTDICFLYTIAGDQFKQYAANQIPSKIKEFEEVATYYQLPSIHMGLYPSFLESIGKLIWKNNKDANDKIVFSKDGTHPTKDGGDLYTQAIIRTFRVLRKTAVVKKHELKNPLYTDNWEDASMYSANAIASFSNGWENINPQKNQTLSQFEPWFQTISKAVTVGASCSFRFRGTAFGFFDIGGPEVGQVLVEIDGKCVELRRKAGNSSNKIVNEGAYRCLVNRFNSNCNNRYRGQFELFEVSDGEHEIKLTVSNITANKIEILQGQDLTDIQQFPQKYQQQVFYLGKVLLKGKLL